LGSAARTSRRQLSEPLALLTFVVLWLFVHHALDPYRIEDSYIHLRVAEHLLRGHRPYFNWQDSLKTSSSTPWVLLLAALLAIAPAGAIAIVSGLISAACAWGFTVLIATAAARPFSLAEKAICILIGLSIVQLASVTGMETPLALLFAVFGLRGWLLGRPSAAALLGVAACVRIELFGLLGACLLFRAQRGAFLKNLAWALLGSAPSSLFDLWAYGTLLPQALQAKRVIHHVDPKLAFTTLAPESLLHHFHSSGVAFAVYGTAVVWMATYPLIAGQLSRAKLADRAWPLMLVSASFGIAVSVAYVAGGALIAGWYRPLYLLPLFVPGLVHAASRGRVRDYLAPLLLAVPLIVDLFATLRAASGHPEASAYFLEGARSRHTLHVARGLAARYPDAVLMASEIGAVGFGFPGRVEDGAGLASRKVLAYYPLSVPDQRLSEADFPLPTRFVSDVRPGIILGLDRHLDGVLRHPLRVDYVHLRLGLYEPEDDARRLSDELLWDSASYLDVLIRRDLWLRHAALPGEGG